jgi:peptidoglycan hydrolase-like protein with peptidoglycan-binding domain
MLRILVRHQDREKAIRLRGEWVDMDPRSWNANMDASINVGLGTGSRERDLAMLGGISKQQDLVVQQLGPGNPVVTPSMWTATRHKMVEAAGLKNADEYFAPITDQQFAQWQSQQQPPVDPKIQLEQAKAQAANQKDEAKLRIGHVKNVMNAQSKGASEAAKIQLEAAKTKGEIDTQAAKVQADATLDAYKAGMDNRRRWAELDMERELKQQELKIKANAPGVTELRNPE